jgi:hypothetical protein
LYVTWGLLVLMVVVVVVAVAGRSPFAVRR